MREHIWKYDNSESDMTNSLCAVETTLWNLGLTSQDNHEWSWSEVYEFVRTYGII